MPVTTLSALWQMDDPDEALELAERLDDHSLLRFDGARETVRLHDTIREYLMGRVEDPSALHARLVDAWGPDWRAWPDGYAWDHYAHHLRGAGRDDALLALFADRRWLYARLERNRHTYAGYVASLMQASERWQNVRMSDLEVAMLTQPRRELGLESPAIRQEQPVSARQAA